MKVTSIRFDQATLNELEQISIRANVDLTSVIRQVTHIGLDLSKKVARAPLSEVPQKWRTPGLLFISEVIRQQDKS